MEDIHNSKKRMPVIIPRESEQYWLNNKITKDDVIALCQPIDDSLTTAAYTVSPLANRIKEDRNVPEIQKPQAYQELNT
jgi:putative SOS response-associated peptidase YedK